MASVHGKLGDFEKYSLKYTDYPTMINNLARILRYSSIKIDSKDHEPISWTTEVLNVIGAACYFYVYIFSAVWFVFVRFPQTGDYIAASVEFSLAVCSGTSILKFIYLKLDSKAVTNLIDEYLKCDARVDPSSRFAENLKKKLRIVKKRAILTWSALALNGVVYITTPFLKPGRHLTEDLYVTYGLEPMFESPNFEIATILMTVAVIFGVLTLANYRLLICVTIGYIEAQMLALSEDLIRLWDDSEKFYEEFSEKEIDIIKTVSPYDIKNVYIKHRLREIIKFHIVGITLQHIVEAKFRFIYVIEFLFVMIGIVTELLGGLENTYFELPYSLNQVFMDCLIGQRLIDASIVFENAVYSCQWENYNASNQRSVLLILQNSQKTLMLSAGGLSALSFVCLMSVIRCTYSAYTALHSTVN
ncbi:odorant receptor 2a-like [Vanessa tameamea]|uniref:Odorant receptor n=1 Tax=Vanessa tameamea TaxID=334116 RepID=A0A8B8IWQ0_VANTA